GAEYLLMILSVLMVLIGISIAYLFYILRPDLPKNLAERFKGPYKLLLNKYYIDELYNFAFVQPFIKLAIWFWRFVDVAIIDGFANGSAYMVGWISGVARKIQTGYVRNYALSLLVGAVFILAYFILR
ncbi:MAG: NADH dehydrogenase, partial [candidate division Zixibacteria bacterium SM23_73_2]